MTPAQLDHLRLIDAHLAKLLSLSAKRTPGEWATARIFGDWGFAHVDQIITRTHRPESDGHGITLSYGGVIQCVGPRDKRNEQSKSDAAFIASCAGNAEAGWKATRAAIADWLSLYNSTEGYADGAQDATAHDKLCNEVASICRINLQHILAAFPLEMLTP